MKEKRIDTIIAEQKRDMIYDYIKFFIIKNGFAPTLREISEASGIPLQTVYTNVQKLIECGRLETDWNKSSRRNIKIPGNDTT